ncbi:Gp49 family protein [Salinisphaera hydrothermalis]|uniref:Phage protein n=1 Tax=Salinisphaera hydrothermalis (strain C41B8) TaxID=1304275 RepID=A0A084INN7_SALHC|nr:Gp49 family protein [Salinisphaera hydrothermalis]KEZ78321.1 hypothetical protein C41B8_05448 [Salinisphaera hydrothermalis C41B8]
MRDDQIEKEIQAKGLNSPRLTPDAIDEWIVGEQYHRFPNTTTTVCCLSLKNGFNVTADSACVSPENFDEEIGRQVARDKAKGKVWELEGYRLKQALHEGRMTEAGGD